MGDRVRYHPDIDYYEKYDKSNDTHILCPFCNKVNPISDDVCKCGAPVLKWEPAVLVESVTVAYATCETAVSQPVGIE